MRGIFVNTAKIMLISSLTSCVSLEIESLSMELDLDFTYNPKNCFNYCGKTFKSE
jgi:hypothetical protein